jgi:hypothetical protein
MNLLAIASLLCVTASEASNNTLNDLLLQQEGASRGRWAAALYMMPPDEGLVVEASYLVIFSLVGNMLLIALCYSQGKAKKKVEIKIEKTLETAPPPSFNQADRVIMKYMQGFQVHTKETNDMKEIVF